MIGAAALLMGASFTSCSKDKDLYDPTANAMKFLQDYQAAFISVFGQPSANQTWGFGDPAQARMTRSGNTNSPDYVEYWYTEAYRDANGKLIASANMNHNQWGSTDLQSNPGGGWIVPDPLTEKQKLRVQLYFQNNPDLEYKDPKYAHFFVQQVYTGGVNAPTTGNGELNKAASGADKTGASLNQLTVGQYNSHINDFNAGTCTSSTVLYDDGHTGSDQITLMLNVDDTACFGYHETSGSNTTPDIQHNDKWALVSAKDIDDWAASADAIALGVDLGAPVTDKWNRSFMGFDYEMLSQEEITLDSYAMLSQVPNLINIHYAWDGQTVMTIGTAPEATQAEEVDITSTFAQNVSGQNVTCSYDDNGNIVCVFAGEYYNSITFTQTRDWLQYNKLKITFAEPSPIAATLSCGSEAQISEGATEVEAASYTYNGSAGPTISSGGMGKNQETGEINTKTLIIKKVTLVKEATAPDASIVYYNPTYLLGDNDADKIAFYSANTNMYGGATIDLSEDEMKTTIDGKVCLNLVKFQELKTNGYHPISNDLKKWAKWEAVSDGYYSDWIVTLTEAQRIGEPDPQLPSLHVMAEDMSAKNAGDFDFNDVVFDVFYVDANTVTIKLLAAGGTMPLRLCENDNWEVHKLFGVGEKCMVNTGTKYHTASAPFSQDTKPYVELTYTGATWTNNQSTFAAEVRDQIKIEVDYGEGWAEVPANIGEPAGKIACPVNFSMKNADWYPNEYRWAYEKQNISDIFSAWVQDETKLWYKE